MYFSDPLVENHRENIPNNTSMKMYMISGLRNEKIPKSKHLMKTILILDFKMSESERHVGLRLAFDHVMSSSYDDFRSLFQTVGVDIKAFNTDFVKDLANYSISELQQASDLINAEIAVHNGKFEDHLFISDRETIEASVENLESVICTCMDSMRSKISKEVGAAFVPHLNNYREEKLKLSSLTASCSMLSEFLGIPSYVEMCISGQKYTEATIIFDWFDALMKNHAKLSSNQLILNLSSQLKSIQANFVSAIEHRFSSDPALNNITEIQSLLDILVMYRPKELEEANQQVLFLVYRMNCFYGMKAKILSSTGTRPIKEYSELIRTFFPELIRQNESLFGAAHSTRSLSRFLVLELRLFESFLSRQIPDVFRRNGLSSVADIHSNVSVTSEHLYEIGFIPDLVSVFEQGFVDVIVKERISKKCLDTFKSELNAYNWKPFTSLIPIDCLELDVLQLTRNRPIGILYNEITTVLNEVRIFPIKSKYDELVRAVDQLLCECFDLLLGTVNNDRKSQMEYDTMKRNFCTVLVFNIEVYLESLFTHKIDLESIKGHEQFIFRGSK
jgi:hypothetical protein